MTFVAAAKVTVAAAMLASGASAVKVTLTAPGHTPKVNVHWSYSVSATSGGKPAPAKVTAQIVDPIGGVHPVQFGTSTKNIVNWPFKGTFRDFIIWPPSSAVGIPLTFRLTVQVRGDDEGRSPTGSRRSGDARGRNRGRRACASRSRADASQRCATSRSEVEPGELVALTGSSGSGKSTLLNLIGALDTPDAGSIVVGEQRLDALDSPSRYRAGTIGFVFQSHNLLPTLTASENVQVPMFGLRPRRERERASGRASRRGRSRRPDERDCPSVLSGGERQRVAIARALANEPQVLLADEPTGALDSATGAQVLELLQAIRRQYGMTILLVTNDDLVAAHADRTLRLRDGVISEDAVTRGEAPRSEQAAPPARSDTERR